MNKENYARELVLESFKELLEVYKRNGLKQQEKATQEKIDTILFYEQLVEQTKNHFREE